MSATETRMAVLSYSTSVHHDKTVAFGDPTGLDADLFKDYMRSMSYTGGYTDTPEALFAADDLFTDENWRPEAKRVVVLVTDGVPNRYTGCPSSVSGDYGTRQQKARRCSRYAAEQLKDQSPSGDVYFVYLRVGSGAVDDLFTGIEDYTIETVFNELSSVIPGIVQDITC